MNPSTVSIYYCIVRGATLIHLPTVSSSGKSSETQHHYHFIITREIKQVLLIRKLNNKNKIHNNNYVGE